MGNDDCSIRARVLTIDNFAENEFCPNPRTHFLEIRWYRSRFFQEMHAFSTYPLRSSSCSTRGTGKGNRERKRAGAAGDRNTSLWQRICTEWNFRHPHARSATLTTHPCLVCLCVVLLDVHVVFYFTVYIFLFYIFVMLPHNIVYLSM